MENAENLDVRRNFSVPISLRVVKAHSELPLFGASFGSLSEANLLNRKAFELFVKSILGDPTGKVISNVREQKLKIGSYNQTEILWVKNHKLCHQIFRWHQHRIHPVYAYDKKFFSIMKRQSFISLRYFYNFIVLVGILEASRISHRLSQRRIPSKFRQTKALPCCIYRCTISELANFSFPLTRVDFNELELTELWTFNWWKHLA